MEVMHTNGFGNYFSKELLQYIKEGHDMKLLLILQGTNPSQLTESSGTSLLHVAARYGNVWLVRSLIFWGANVDAQNLLMETPLMFAIRNSRLEIVKMLLEANADIYIPDKLGVSPLRAAFIFNNEMLKLHLDRVTSESLYFSRHIENGFFHSHFPLHYFILLKNVEVIKVLLEKGSPVDARQESTQETSLHIAVKQMDLEKVSLLLAYGAKVNAKDNRGTTPLALLNKFTNQDKALAIMQMLIASGATLIDYDQSEILASSWLENGYKEIVRHLLSCKINLHFRDKWCGKTPLHYLASNRNTDILEELRHYYFDIEIPTRNHEWTMLFFAASSGNASSIKFLLERGANVNATCRFKFYTPLNVIILDCEGCGYQKNYKECIDILLTCGADPQIVTEDNYADIEGPLETFAEPISCDILELMKPILAHLSLMEASGKRIGRRMQTVILSVLQFKKVFNSKKVKCEEMKQIKLGKSVTLLDFLSATDKDISLYAENRKLFSSLFNDLNIYTIDPYYQQKLMSNILKFTELLELRRKSMIVIETIFVQSLEISVRNIAEKIVNYLGDLDLKILLSSPNGLQ